MKRLFLITILMLSLSTLSVAAPYVHSKLYSDGVIGFSPDPLQTVGITDNDSHTISTAMKLWYDIVNTGSSICYVRLMNTSTKDSWVQESIPVAGKHSYVIHGNTNFLNYSGCNGAVLHLM